MYSEYNSLTTSATYDENYETSPNSITINPPIIYSKQNSVSLNYHENPISYSITKVGNPISVSTKILPKIIKIETKPEIITSSFKKYNENTQYTPNEQNMILENNFNFSKNEQMINPLIENNIIALPSIVNDMTQSVSNTDFQESNYINVKKPITFNSFLEFINVNDEIKPTIYENETNNFNEGNQNYSLKNETFPLTTDIIDSNHIISQNEIKPSLKQPIEVYEKPIEVEEIRKIPMVFNTNYFSNPININQYKRNSEFIENYEKIVDEKLNNSYTANNFFKRPATELNNVNHFDKNLFLNRKQIRNKPNLKINSGFNYFENYKDQYYKNDLDDLENYKDQYYKSDSNDFGNYNYNLNDGPSDNFNPKEFQILGLIGKGSFSSIYEVRWKKNGKKYALKKSTSNSTDEAKERRKRIETLLKSIRNKYDGFINVYGEMIDEKTNCQYILMELADNDWSKEIDDKKNTGTYYTEEEILSILRKMTYTLALLQSKNISHRNIKPTNILIVKGRYKLASFGDSKVVNDITAPQLPIGTEMFMSPLLLKAMHNNPLVHNNYKSDVYSLGMCILLAATLSYTTIQKIRDLNDYQRMAFLMNCLSERYSMNLVNILYKVLQPDENQRPDFIELKKIVCSQY